MSSDSREAMRQSWEQWFADVDSHARFSGFERWKRLKRQSDELTSVLRNSEFDFSEANRLLEKANRILDFSRPYQVVVIGESGAGKSSLINALLDRSILVTGTGGAVTGVATYIFPGSVNSAEDERVDVIYRSVEEIQSLLAQIEHSPSGLQENLAVSSEQTDNSKIDLTISDIQTSWATIQKLGLEGKRVSYHPQADKVVLEQFMEEHSSKNAPGSSQRTISGIKRIEYHLSGQTQGLVNCVLIDTPGLGARTLRHQEILRSEIEMADAVVLVVNARRPEHQTDQVATLMRNILFSSYTSEQRNNFSAKVFLIANQHDAIQSEPDHRRLQISIQEISEVIAPDYWQRYGKNSAEKRYFEMIATDVSRVATLQERLRDFLANRRLDLMLDEASTVFSLAQSHAKKVCETVLAEVRFNTARMSAETLRATLVNQVCLNRLDRDFTELMMVINQVFESLSDYRDSSQHEENIREIVTHIRKSSWDCITSTLPDLLQNLELRTYNSTTGKYVSDTAENTLLLRLESAVWYRLEKEMEEQFAQYFVKLFYKELESKRLYNSIDAKSYGQLYITESLDPVSELKREEKRICEDYIAASRQILVYELLQTPIIESLRRVESRIWTVIKASDVFLPLSAPKIESDTASSSAATAPNESFGWASRLKNIGKQIINETIGVSMESGNRTEDLAAEKLRDKRFTDSLRDVLGAGNSLQRDDKKLLELLTYQFSQRIDNALKNALPHLESVFFYALDRYRVKYSGFADEIRQAHLLRVNDPQANIQQILVERNEEIISRLTKAATVLAQIDRVARLV